ncbi:MAG TPA: transcription antiterminator BglG [Firmicutes bacterium]|jgi:activator of the mannose operon, transcriptional antiterminator|nr:transcription antiterminator BglG [Bacillota bacterium]
MDRLKMIINILLKSKAPVTINAIAEQLEVSNRTIRNNLTAVEKFINEKGLTLKKKPGIGIQLEGPEESFHTLNEMKMSTYISEPFSPQDRKDNILKRLFMSENTITINDLAKELYVSDITIRKDLEDVDLWLAKFKLKLMRRQNYGIKIIGSEENCRNALANLIVIQIGFDKLKGMLHYDTSAKLDYHTLNQLTGLINIDYIKLENIVNQAERSLGYKFTDEAFGSLVIHIAIAIKRLQDGKDILLAHSVLEDLKTKAEYRIAKQIADSIEIHYRVKLPEQEIGYILLHILGSKLQENNIDDLDLKNEGEHELAVIMAKEIIHIAQKTLSIDLSKDKQALNGLILHLRPTIKRLEYGLNLRNPLLDQIKENYPEIFGVAWISNTVFERYLGKKITEEEIGYIALHLGAAIERQKKGLSALVVCTSGMGTSQFLAVKLENHFKEIKIKQVISAIALKDYCLDDVDIVISTVPLTAQKPVLHISPLLTQNDVLKISSYIDSLNKRPTHSIINEDSIQIAIRYRDKENAIHDMCSRLIEKGYVTEDFEKSVLKRENIQSTEIGKGVAIPHGFPEKVCRSQIALSILQEPIPWGNEHVDIIFLIALSDIDALNSAEVLKKLYKKVDSDDFLDRLKKAQAKDQIRKIIETINQ